MSNQAADQRMVCRSGRGWLATIAANGDEAFATLQRPRSREVARIASGDARAFMYLAERSSVRQLGPARMSHEADLRLSRRRPGNDRR